MLLFNDAQRLFETGGLLLYPRHQFFELAWAVRCDKATTALVIAVYLLCLDEVTQPVKCVTRFADKRTRLGTTVTAVQLVEAWFDFTADLPTITGAASPAKISSLG